ncbi:MAG: sigma 54-dependent Fis family transcriptional regulator [Polyangiaceae bacterium]|nr:sigma 54-dependent Fis family transcriptional regulator [Polyangiaceae bacterium]
MTRSRDEVTTPLAPPPPARALDARARVIEPAGLARPLTLRPAQPVIVGSDATADWVLADKTVSRRHVELELGPEGVRVRDLGSRNGTHVAEHRVEQARLALGVTLRLGRVVVALDVDPATVAASPSHDADTYERLTCRSPAMKRVAGVLARLEASLVTVLIEGPSGVGKELVAEAIHARSPRAAGKLVSLNCGALPRELVASELFGHVRGAFTGAGEARRGAFEAADGGTLFLDEIAELPLEVQPVLLRALATGEVRRVGSDAVTKRHARVLAATNRDLVEEVRAGRFREDLYYRLAVIRVTVPPLSERPEDVAPLARAFAAEAGVELPPSVSSALEAARWPGNARELRNAVQAYAVLGHVPESACARGDTLQAALRAWLDPRRPYAEQKEALLELFARDYLAAVLAQTRGNVSAAAKVSGLDRGWVAKLADKHKLRDPG